MAQEGVRLMGSLRFRRSISLGGGVRLNFNKTSLGISAGIPGVRYSVNTSGQSARSAGIPGTGLYYRSQTRPRRPRASPEGRARAEGTGRQGIRQPPTVLTPDIVEQVIPKPGFLASATEKQFRKGLVAYLQQNWSDAAQAFELASATDSRNLSDDYFLGATYVRLQRLGDAATCFEKVIGSQQVLPDDLMRKYVPGGLVMQLPITDRVTVSVGFNSIGGTLILTELYQQLGRRSEAIGLVQRLHQLAPEDQAIRLSLADLLYDDNDFQGLIEVTDGVENNDDVTLAMLHLKAKALANQGLLAPAAEVLTTCPRRTAGRDPDLLKEIRYNRAEAYELLGDSRKAKADWAKLVAEDPLYRDSRTRLQGSLT
jgi:tetratricopeptide (TPR) repeat protein